MKKYDMSIVDFSEIRFLSAEENAEEIKEKMTERGLLTEKGNSSISGIRKVNEHNTPQFLSKLEWRMRRKERGLERTYHTFSDLWENGEYTAMFLLLVFLYGYVGWRIPLDINLMSSDRNMLKGFFDGFMEIFCSYLEGENGEEAE